VRDALGPAPVHTAEAPRLVASADAINSKPIQVNHDFHYRGDTAGCSRRRRQLRADGDLRRFFPSRRIRFDLDNADFATALAAVSAATKTFSVALDDKVLFACVDNPDNHHAFDRMGLRSFYISGGPAATELNDLMNALRTLLSSSS